jgi:Asp-tRNA(Asn)/Glu-tRNA(Gln) amidotransferase C subunit
MISIEVLESIPIDAETGTAAHGLPYTELNSPVPREDVVQQNPHRQAILDQAPELEDGYIVVPDISHQELE